MSCCPDAGFLFRNEAEVYDAIRKSDVSREDVFVVTKLMWTNHGYDATVAAVTDSLSK